VAGLPVTKEQCFRAGRISPGDDARVSFIANEIDINLYRAPSTRAGREKNEVPQ
jgi:hypothetical protein